MSTPISIDVLAAVKHFKHRRGPSRSEINDYFKNNINTDSVSQQRCSIRSECQRLLKRAVENGQLLHNNGRYRLVTPMNTMSLRSSTRRRKLKRKSKEEPFFKRFRKCLKRAKSRPCGAWEGSRKRRRGRGGSTTQRKRKRS